LKSILQQAAYSSKVPAVQAGALQCLAVLIRQIVEDESLDHRVLMLDIQKIFPLFEKNCTTDPIISAAACSLMNEMLN